MNDFESPRECSVDGCERKADYAVALVRIDFAGRMGSSHLLVDRCVVEQDETCEFICWEHAVENEVGRLPETNGVADYPSSDRSGHDAFCHYLSIGEWEHLLRVGHQRDEGGTAGIKNRRPGDRWGGWRLTSHRTLIFEPGTWREYEVDLEGINDARAVVDWIAQLTAKTWMTPQDLGAFAYALNDCIPLREKLLFGRSGPYDVPSERPWIHDAEALRRRGAARR